MRVGFIGCVLFSRAALQRTVNLPGVEVVGVVTRRASPINSDFVQLDDIAAPSNATIYYADDGDQNSLAAWLRQREPDVIYCFGWSYLLRQEVLDVPKLGIVGFHPAALPQNRGRHPIIWALALGLKKTASTFFMMDQGADTGDIISQASIDIASNDNGGTLYAKITQAALDQITAITASLQTGTLQRRPQPPGSGNSWRRRTEADGQIDWRMSAKSVNNLIRALGRPYVGAHCIHSERETKIWRAELTSHRHDNIEPGKVLDLDGSRITVKCGEDAITLLEHDFADLPSKGTYL